MPKVTVGLPVFNGERFIRQSVESVLGQTYPDFELIISDNASTDSTLSICREFASRDRRIRILTSPVNRGAAPNYNLLVHEASGKYFRWMPCDDLIAPTCLEECVGYLEAHPSVILCYPSTRPIDEDGNPADRKPEDTLEITAARPSIRLRQYFETSFENRQCNAVLGVVRTDVLRKTGLIGSYAASDKILLAELALLGPFHQLPATLFFRRYHSMGSNELYPKASERAEWFDSSKRKRKMFMQWRWFGDFFGAIRRADLSLRESLVSYLQMGRYYGLYRDILWQNLERDLRVIQKDLRRNLRVILRKAGGGDAVHQSTETQKP